MSGQVFLIIGKRGSGKTTWAKKILAKSHPESRLVLDVNGEYKELFPKPPIDFNVFTKMVLTARKAVILVEEATTFLSTRGRDKDIVKLLVAARHNETLIMFVFHSLRDVPLYIYRLSNKVILHKTGDTVEDIDNRFHDPQLVEVFKRLQAAPYITNEQGKQYSPSEVYNIF